VFFAKLIGMREVLVLERCKCSSWCEFYQR
jgi:hypothetical protein